MLQQKICNITEQTFFILYTHTYVYISTRKSMIFWIQQKCALGLIGIIIDMYVCQSLLFSSYFFLLLFHWIRLYLHIILCLRIRFVTEAYEQ